MENTPIDMVIVNGLNNRRDSRFAGGEWGSGTPAEPGRLDGLMVAIAFSISAELR